MVDVADMPVKEIRLGLDNETTMLVDLGPKNLMIQCPVYINGILVDSDAFKGEIKAGTCYKFKFDGTKFTLVGEEDNQ